MRGVAITVVVFGHLLQRLQRFHQGESCELGNMVVKHLSAAAAGVYLFFTISGYLMAARLSEFVVFRRSWLLSFYFRRLTRIAFPYYFILVTTYLIIEGLAFAPRNAHQFARVPASLFESLIASLGFSHTLLFGTYPRLFPPGWSNEVEVQFYLITPLLCLGYARVQGPVQRRLIGGVCFLTSVLLARFALDHGPARFGHTLLFYLPYFWLGILLFDLTRAGPKLRGRCWTVLGWLALLAFAVQQPFTPDRVEELVSRCALIALLFGSLSNREGSFYRFCSSKPLRVLGVYAYSIYLVHLQVLHLVADHVFTRWSPSSQASGILLLTVVSAPLITVAALACHSMLERPAIRLGKSNQLRILFRPLLLRPSA